MQLEVSQSLRTRLDIAAAIDAEIAYVPPYLPPTMLVQALGGHVEELKQLLEGHYRQTFQLEEAEVIQVSKKGTGLRPVTAVDFPSRVLYRALTGLVEPGLPELDRTFERKQELERVPLADPESTYVVLSDVAAFYDGVDHGRLVQELVAQTGEGEVADAIANLLGALMGRRFGLPQVLYPSDLLSDVFIDVAERDLLRAGLAVTRYNDDFWIAAKTWPEAQEALAALSRAIRDLGLTLNEVKTFPLLRDRYEAWLNLPEERWAQINENVQLDLRDVGGYAEEADVPDNLPEQEVQVAEAAVLALQLALPNSLPTRYRLR